MYHPVFPNGQDGAMSHPNYNHLLYFWAVVREGSVAGAAPGDRMTQEHKTEHV
jgi:hypothetical protein